jgi:cell division protein FtsW
VASTVMDAPATPAPAGRGSSAVVRLRRLFPTVSGNELLLAGTTLFLVVFGLVMVLSSSAIESRAENGSMLGAFQRQGLFALVGVPLMLVGSRMPATFWRRIAWVALAGGLGLQLLVFVPGLGVEIGGNRNWLLIGGFSLQPSEFLKLALVVWMGAVLSTKGELVGRFLHAWIPIVPFAGGAIALVLLGKDFGTAVIMVMLVLGGMWFAGVRWWHLLLPMLVVVVAAVPIAISSDSRVQRIQTFFVGCQNTDDDYWGPCWQQLHGTWALANGGLFGVGLGNSRAKWMWLAEADNDYIFAIIGEELGLVGATIVLLLFLLLAVALLRIIRDARTAMTRIVTGGVLVWLVGQAIVNVCVVLGLLPVLGVPLPLISAGGSQLIATLLAIGVVLSLARGDARLRQTGA